MNALHVFVCFGALPFEASLAILANLRREDPDCAAAFLLTFEVDESRVPDDVRVFRLTPAMQTYSRWEKPFKVAAWFEHVHQELLATGMPLHVYVSHPAELPGNHFLFHKRAGDEVDLLPDGLLNYVHTSLAPERFVRWPRYLVRVVLELLAAKVHGFSYVPLLSGHQTQFEQGLYDASWTFRPEGYLTRSGSLKIVPRRAEAERSAEQKASLPVVLFLDQELHGIVDADLEAEMRALATRVVGEQSPRRVLYKAHPRGKNRVDELRREGLVVEDASGPEPAETLIELHEIAAVVGFYSTTLLLLSADQVGERVAILPRAERASVRRPELVQQTTDAFLGSGVRVVVSEAGLLERGKA